MGEIAKETEVIGGIRDSRGVVLYRLRILSTSEQAREMMKGLMDANDRLEGLAIKKGREAQEAEFKLLEARATIELLQRRLGDV